MRGGDISIDSTDIKLLIRRYNEQLYGNAFNNLALVNVVSQEKEIRGTMIGKKEVKLYFQTTGFSL